MIIEYSKLFKFILVFHDFSVWMYLLKDGPKWYVSSIFFMLFPCNPWMFPTTGRKDPYEKRWGLYGMFTFWLLNISHILKPWFTVEFRVQGISLWFSLWFSICFFPMIFPGPVEFHRPNRGTIQGRGQQHSTSSFQQLRGEVHGKASRFVDDAKGLL